MGVVATVGHGRAGALPPPRRVDRAPAPKVPGGAYRRSGHSVTQTGAVWIAAETEREELQTLLDSMTFEQAGDVSSHRQCR